MDPHLRYRSGVALQAINTILDRWARNPASRWLLDTGSSETLGEATVTVLSPSPEIRAKHLSSSSSSQAADPNLFSSALTVEWGGLRLVLGSDLVEKPGQGWSRVVKQFTHVVDHAGLKVAHHGSKDAYDRAVLQRATGNTPLCVVTPFASQRLPRFEDQEGIHKLLGHVAEVHLTSLPRAHSSQAASIAARFTRAELQSSGTFEFDPVTPGFPDCYVMAEFERGDPRPAVRSGPGSIVVVR